MKSELFQHELGKTSAVFGRKHDVQVIFRGDGAATNGSTIYLPAMDMDADVSDDQADVMRGYVDHEAGHVRHSDFAALAALGQECQASGNTLLRSLHNALEDIWLERRVMNEYPGAERNLRATTTAVNQEFINQVPAGDARLRDDMFVAAVACTWEGRKHYGGDTCQQCLDLLSDDLRNVLPTWIAGLDGCRNSQDVIDLARIVEKSIRTGDYKQEPEESNDASDSGDSGDAENQTDADDNGQDANDAGEGNGTGQQQDAVGSDDANPQANGPKQSADSGDDQDGQSTSARGATEASEGDNVYEDFDLSGVVQRMTDAAGLTGDAASGSYRVLDTSMDEWHSRQSETKMGGNMRHMEQRKADYDSVVEGMAGSVNVMRRKLERALIAKQTRDWDAGREQGRLDTRRLTSAYAGRTNVFKMREDRNEIDTAITLLIDLSGSMSGREAYVAMQCAVAMSEAVDRTGVKYEVLGFNNRGGSHIPQGMEYSDVYDEDTGRYRYGRIEALSMYVFKQFDERLHEAKGVMASLHKFAGGHNTDGDALAYAYERLRARPEKRKVMMVFSDGMPTGFAGDDVQEQRLRNVVGRIERDDVDMVGVGILTDAVSRFYPKWVVVNDIEQLANNVMDQLSRVLLGERFQIDNSKLMKAQHAV